MFWGRIWENKMAKRLKRIDNEEGDQGNILIYINCLVLKLYSLILTVQANLAIISTNSIAIFSIF